MLRSNRKPISADAARVRMADLCARAEHCEHEITEKLRRLGLPASDITGVIDSLASAGFIDNARYARSFATDKVRFAGWGRNKIRLHLAAKRIASRDISDALESIDPDDYLDALRRATEAKSRSLDLADPADRQRLYRHLLQRGFESALISKAIHNLSRN